MPKDAESLKAVSAALLNANRSPEELRSISELLCEVKCCHDCPAALLTRLCGSAQARVYARGEEVCRQGEVAAGLLIVLEGLVAVTVRKHGLQTYVARLGPLATIGEAALAKELLSSSTVTALLPTVICLVARADYLSSLSSQTQQDQINRAAFLRSTALFQQLSKQGVLKLAGYFSECRLKRGEVFYREGDSPLAVFLIVSGQVEFLKTHVLSTCSQALPVLRPASSLPPCQSVLSLCLKGSGELFGQEEVMSGGNRQCSACCASVQCVALGISKADFLRRLQNGDIWARMQSWERAKRQWNASRFEDLKAVEVLKQSFTERSITPVPYTVQPNPSPAKSKHSHSSSSIFPTEVPTLAGEQSLSCSPLPFKVLSKAQIQHPRLRPVSIISSVRSQRCCESVRLERSSSSLDSPLLKGIFRPIGVGRRRGNRIFQAEKKVSRLSDYGQSRNYL